MFPTQFRNFERGRKFENIAVKHFENFTGSTTSTCGFFLHPLDKNYGASPDAICPGSLLLDIKTRAEKSTAPLDYMVNICYKLNYKWLVLVSAMLLLSHTIQKQKVQIFS